MAVRRHGSLSSSIARWHGDERTVGSPLNDAEVVALRWTRLFGATGTVLMAIGSLGAGARPVVQDPTFGVRLLNLPSRMQTVSLTMTTTGAVMMALAWLMAGPLRARRAPDVTQPTGPDAAAVDAAAADRTADVQQGRLALSGAKRNIAARPRPVPRRPGTGPGSRPRLHAVGAQPVAASARGLGICGTPCDGRAGTATSPIESCSVRKRGSVTGQPSGQLGGEPIVSSEALSAVTSA